MESRRSERMGLRQLDLLRHICTFPGMVGLPCVRSSSLRMVRYVFPRSLGTEGCLFLVVLRIHQESILFNYVMGNLDSYLGGFKFALM